MSTHAKHADQRVVIHEGKKKDRIALIALGRSTTHCTQANQPQFKAHKASIRVRRLSSDGRVSS